MVSHVHQRPQRRGFLTPGQLQVLLTPKHKTLEATLVRLKRRLDQPKFLDHNIERELEED